MGCWLYICFDQLPLEALHWNSSNKYIDPTINSVPAVLVDSRNRVMLVNQSAWEFGINPGMSVTTASCLAANLWIGQSDDVKTAKLLNGLASWAYQYCADISIDAPQGLLLNLLPMQQFYGDLASCLCFIHQQLQALPVSTRPGYSESPATARILARQGMYCPMVSAGARVELVNNLSVDSLELDQKNSRRLQSMGIRTIQDLFCQSSAELGYRLGESIISVIHGLWQDQHLFTPFHPVTCFYRQREFYYEVVNTQGLLFPLKPLLSELQNYLSAQQKAAERVVLRLKERNGVYQTLVVHAAGGAVRMQDWLALFQIELDRLQLAAPVLAFELQIPVLQEQVIAGGELFGRDPNQQSGERLVSLLVARLGQDSVCIPVVRRESRYYYAGELKPVMSKESNKQVTVFNKPHPVWTTSLSSSDNPRSILMGPERVSSGWWSGNPDSADYYIVRYNSGECIWIRQTSRKVSAHRGGYG